MICPISNFTYCILNKFINFIEVPSPRLKPHVNIPYRSRVKCIIFYYSSNKYNIFVKTSAFSFDKIHFKYTYKVNVQKNFIHYFFIYSILYNEIIIPVKNNCCLTTFHIFGNNSIMTVQYFTLSTVFICVNLWIEYDHKLLHLSFYIINLILCI